MFKFLKEKLNSVVKKFSKDVEEESEVIEVKQEEKPEVKLQPKPEIKKTEKTETKLKEKEEPKKKEQSEKYVEKKSEPKLETKQVPKKEEKKIEKVVDKEIKETKAKKEKKETKKTEKVEIPVHKHHEEKPKQKEAKEEKIKESKEEKKPEEVSEDEKEELAEEIKLEEIAQEHKEHKKGFFSKLFGHKEKIHEEKKAEKEESEDELEKKEEIKEEEAGVGHKISKKEEKNIVDEIEDELDVEIEKDLEEEIEKEEEARENLQKKKPQLKSEKHEKIEEESKEESENAAEEESEDEFKEEESEEKAGEIETKKEKKGFFTKITETFTKINLSEDKFEELFWDLEVMLLENNVAVEVIQKIKDDLKKELMSDKISRKNVDEIIKDSLKQSLEEVLDVKGFNIEDKIKHKKPYIIAVIGVNGSGKTTTIAKLCHLLKKNGHSVVLAAADTFRAAAIQQLEHHAEKLDIKMIKHDYNSDPAAVAFDAIKHAEAKKIDVVIIDTAGRLHSNDNLMNELKKLIKVNKPDLKLFVGESITGNDCVEQAKVYDEIIGIDAIILSKADIDEKGGAALSISYVTQKPVLFVGTGQTYDDLKPFNKKEIMEGLGF